MGNHTQPEGTANVSHVYLIRSVAYSKAIRVGERWPAMVRSDTSRVVALFAGGDDNVDRGGGAGQPSTVAPPEPPTALPFQSPQNGHSRPATQTQSQIGACRCCHRRSRPHRLFANRRTHLILSIRNTQSERETR